jgi:hypothetical protein
MYKFRDKIRLLNDVEIEIKGIFPADNKYSININGIERRMDSEFLDFLVAKYLVEVVEYKPVVETKEEPIVEEVIIEKPKKVSKKKEK